MSTLSLTTFVSNGVSLLRSIMSTRLVKCLLTLGAYTKRYEASELTQPRDHCQESGIHVILTHSGQRRNSQDALYEISMMGGVKCTCGRGFKF